MKNVFLRHPLIFTLLIIAFIVDLRGVTQSIAPGTSSFSIGSVLVIAYFLGTAPVIRALAKES
jgi:hypothetical protein